MTHSLLHQFQQLVAQRIGLHIRPRESEAFQATLLSRSKAHKLADPQAYFYLLEGGSAPAELEWLELACRMTNPESYFFRDQGQMALLRERILPELIERNRASRTVRLWSAGCSTGEEAYSLAMLMDGLLPHRDDWQVQILGTDLNENALQRARLGAYGLWSFRSVDHALKERYFRPVHDRWEVAAHIRRMVTFGSSNLVLDPFPDERSGRCDMDLILCRNVFIYFERGAVSAVMRKFAQTLREGGYLITGHAETYDQLTEGLQRLTFSESLVYKRLAAGALAACDRVSHSAAPPAPVADCANVTPRSGEWSRAGSQGWASTRVAARISTLGRTSATVESAGKAAGVETAKAQHHGGEHAAAPANAESLLEPQSVDYEATYLLALAHAQSGQPALAETACRRASELHPLAAAPYELLATLVEDRGDHDEAKRLLKKVIYLSPASAAAYLELGALYAREGEPERARTMRTTALELLRLAPASAPVELWGGPTAAEWVQHVEALLAEGD